MKIKNISNPSITKLFLYIKYNLINDTFFIDDKECYYRIDYLELSNSFEDFEKEIDSIQESSFFDIIEFYCDELSEEEYFKYLSLINKNIKLSEHLDCIPMLEKKGLDFDFSLVEDDEEYVGIDALSSIKFIKEKEANKVKEIEDVVNRFLKESKYPEVSVWLMTVFQRHLFNNDLNEGEISHIIDWMNSPDCDKKILEKNMSYNKAKAKSNRWTELENERVQIELNKRRALAEKEGESLEIEGVDVKLIYTTSNGLKLYKLLSHLAKKIEGSNMKNCISSSLHVNNDNLYSLRVGDKSICSLDIRNDMAKEIKGYNNKAVEKEYWDDVKECLNVLNIDFLKSRNLENIGLKKITLKSDIVNINKEVLVDYKNPLYDGNKVRQIESDIYFYTPEEELNRREKMIGLVGKNIWKEIRFEFDEFVSNCLVCPIHGVYFSSQRKRNSNFITKVFNIYESTGWQDFKDYCKKTLNYKEERKLDKFQVEKFKKNINTL